MSRDLEDQLRQALRPVDPDEEFAQRVMRRIESERAPPRRSQTRRLQWWHVAVAASAVLTLIVVHDWQTRREQQGLEARRQLIEALRLTGEKLDIAYQVVNEDDA